MEAVSAEMALFSIDRLAVVLFRMVLAIILGGMLGIERGRKHRPAGFRTYILVCMGAALVMMTNQFVFDTYGVGDATRMGAQVISGIGFLGAGTIVLTRKNQVKGITTAAGLWAAACCGLAAGIGFYEGAIAGGLGSFFVMFILQRVDGVIHRNSKVMEVYLEYNAGAPLGELICYARQHGLELSDIQMQKPGHTGGVYASVILTVKMLQKQTHYEVIEALSGAAGINHVEEL